MKSLRKNVILMRVLLGLFLVQLFVPLGVATAQSAGQNGLDGIIICTSTGLKRLTTDGELVSIADGDQQSTETCYVCIVAAMAPVIASGDAVGALLALANKVSYELRPVGLFAASNHYTAGFSARAPPYI